MKAGIVMSLNCDDCDKRYSFADNELDDYNIYWVITKDGPRPKLLCPVCTDKAVAKLES